MQPLMKVGFLRFGSPEKKLKIYDFQNIPSRELLRTKENSKQFKWSRLARGSIGLLSCTKKSDPGDGDPNKDDVIDNGRFWLLTGCRGMVIVQKALIHRINVFFK